MIHRRHTLGPRHSVRHYSTYFQSGAIGDLPQTYSHLALIFAAYCPPFHAAYRPPTSSPFLQHTAPNFTRHTALHPGLYHRRILLIVSHGIPPLFRPLLPHRECNMQTTLRAPFASDIYVTLTSPPRMANPLLIRPVSYPQSRAPPGLLIQAKLPYLCLHLEHTVLDTPTVVSFPRTEIGLSSEDARLPSAVPQTSSKFTDLALGLCGAPTLLSCRF
jgi:hypothetical protein